MFTNGSTHLYVKYKLVLLTIKSAVCVTGSPVEHSHLPWNEYIKCQFPAIICNLEFFQKKRTDQQVQGDRSIITGSGIYMRGI